MNLKGQGRILLLTLKKTDKVTEQIEKKSQETLKIKLKKAKEFFLCRLPLNLEEEKRLLGVAILEAFNSQLIFNITAENYTILIFSSGF